LGTGRKGDSVSSLAQAYAAFLPAILLENNGKEKKKEGTSVEAKQEGNNAAPAMMFSEYLRTELQFCTS